MHKISLFIVGAQKAGTTSLKNYLGEHPQIVTHSSQEFSFFYDDSLYCLGEDDQFKAAFDLSGESGKIIVAKHAHFYSSEKALERLYLHNPHCKLVFILRNPMDRAYSSYLMEKLYQRVDFEFEELIEELKGKAKCRIEPWQREAILEFGYYDKYLQKIYEVFPREQVKIILFEDFSINPLKFCHEIFSEFKIKKDFYPRVRVKHNESSLPRSKALSVLLKNFLIQDNKYKKVVEKIIPEKFHAKLGSVLRNINRSRKGNSKLKAEARKELMVHYGENIVRLEKITGLNLSKWREV